MGQRVADQCNLAAELGKGPHALFRVQVEPVAAQKENAVGLAEVEVQCV